MATTYCEKCKKETESKCVYKPYKGENLPIMYCKECGAYKDKDTTKSLLRNLSRHMQSDIDANNRAKYEAEHPKCPYCNSRNTKRISAATKGLHAALFGVFAVGKVSKQWHCNNCRSDF